MCHYPRRFAQIASGTGLAPAAYQFSGGNLLHRWRFEFRQGYGLGAPVVLISGLEK
jgi:hypothetical protein